VDGKIETTIHPDLVRKYDAGQGKQDSRESIKLKIELATLIVIFIYTAVAAWQGCSNQRAANAAKSAADTAARSLLETNRSWIEILLADEWNKPRSINSIKRMLSQIKFRIVTLVFTNIGNFPIKEIHIEGNVEVVNSSEAVSFHPASPHYDRSHANMGRNILFPGRNGDFTAAAFPETNKGTEKITPLEINEMDRKGLTDGSKYIMVYARGTFIDGFGKHWVEFCEPIFFVVPFQGKYGDCINYNDAGDGNMPQD
jgi:hypothetical protein